MRYKLTDAFARAPKNPSVSLRPGLHVPTLLAKAAKWISCREGVGFPLEVSFYYSLKAVCGAGLLISILSLTF
jgi:hypothetical protein